MVKKFIGVKRTTVKRVGVVKRTPISRNKLSVSLKHTGKIPPKEKWIKNIRSKGYWNTLIVKGSSVYAIERKKLSKSQKQRLRKLFTTPEARRERRRKFYNKLEKIFNSKNPAFQVKIGDRIT